MNGACLRCSSTNLGLRLNSQVLECLHCGAGYDYSAWLAGGRLVSVGGPADPNKTPPLYPSFELPDESPPDAQAKTYPTCLKCGIELCEVLDRTPEDDVELLRCIRCKDGRKYTRGGTGTVW